MWKKLWLYVAISRQNYWTDKMWLVILLYTDIK